MVQRAKPHVVQKTKPHMANKLQRDRHFTYSLVVAAILILAILGVYESARAQNVAPAPVEATATMTTVQPGVPTAIARSTTTYQIVTNSSDELFTPDQISGGLQSTITDVKWGTDSDVSSASTESGWSDVTVAISVKCILRNGCKNISVMDYDLVYDNKYVGVVIYGAQQEFEQTDLQPNETTSGAVTFGVPSQAKSFTVRYDPKPVAIAEFSK